MLRICLSFILMMLFLLPAKADLSQLQAFLQQREEIAKIFLPQQLLVGEKARLIVQAPNAQKITILGSFSQNGISAYPDLRLSLGKDYQVLAEIDTLGLNQVSYTLSWSEKEMQEMVNQDYFIEAVITYIKDGQNIEKRAAPFGASANFIGYNGIRILPQPKDRSGLADVARTMIPGMGNASGAGTGY